MASGSENDEQRRFANLPLPHPTEPSSLPPLVLLRSAFITAMRAGIIKSRPSAQLVSMVAASSYLAWRFGGGCAGVKARRTTGAANRAILIKPSIARYAPDRGPFPARTPVPIKLIQYRIAAAPGDGADVDIAGVDQLAIGAGVSVRWLEWPVCLL
jgi:hypothetical protein